jgi:hypothetical protein
VPVPAVHYLACGDPERVTAIRKSADAATSLDLDFVAAGVK